MKDIEWLTDNTCKICGKTLGDSTAVNNDICYECKENQHSFSGGFSCSVYDGPVREILSGLKYRGRSYYADKISDIMSDRAAGFIEKLGIDLIIAVPMFKKKERTRGYDQAHLIASGLAKKLDIKYRNDVLIKTKNTLSMSSLDSAERRINLHNAFDIGYNVDDIKNKNVLLVDDVYTTGSTADSCSEVLNRNGANEVYIFTFTSGRNMKRRP